MRSAAGSSSHEPHIGGKDPWRPEDDCATLTAVHSVLIVDDHAAVRAGLTALIDGGDDLQVAGTAADAEAAFAAADELRPRLVVIDFHLPGEDGLSLCLRLTSLTPAPGLVLYSAFADDLLAALAAVAGADALVPKSADPEQLLSTLLAVAAGESVRARPSPAALTTVGAALEPADLPILGMLLHGTPPAELADTLGMSAEWLQARRWAILRRLSPRRARRGARTSAAGSPADAQYIDGRATPLANGFLAATE
jgi:DNA-binding NarL/FixJ family response regulator